MVAEELRQQYTQKLLPLEENYCFHEFLSQSWRILTLTLSACGFSWASTGGKTAFPLHLVEQDFPGMWTGLSTPLTCLLLCHYTQPHHGVVFGHELPRVMGPRCPFRKVSTFGNGFQNRLICPAAQH